MKTKKWILDQNQKLYMQFWLQNPCKKGLKGGVLLINIANIWNEIKVNPDPWNGINYDIQ